MPANLTRAIDFINELNDRLGWPQMDSLDVARESWTSKQRKLVSLVNRTLKTMGGLNDWPLLRKEGTLVLIGDETSSLTSGSEEYVTATQNSQTVTVANATFDDTYIDRAFQVSGDNYIHRLTAVPSATTLTIKRAWVEDSITASDEKTYTIAMDRYALPVDFDRFTDDLQGFFSPYNIQPISPEEFRARRRHGNGIEVGDPEVFTVFGMNAGQTAQLIHFDPFPDDARLLNFDYQKLHHKLDSDNDKILYPERYVEVLIEVILETAVRDYEDDAKVQILLIDSIRKYNQQLANPSVTGTTPRLRPSGNIRESIRRKYGDGGLPFDYGVYFDRSDVYGLKR